MRPAIARRLPGRRCLSAQVIEALPWDAGKVYFGVAPNADLGAVRPGHAGQFYQRVLPVQQVPFASPHGRVLFKEALKDGTMESFFYLAEQFRRSLQRASFKALAFLISCLGTQDEPTFCGLTTLAMVLNSLRIDPMRTWKGAWRWYNEQNLACCFGTARVRAEGLSFDMFSSLARCNGAEVKEIRATGADFLESFREAVRATCQSRASVKGIRASKRL